jgi:hypothetical protein
VGNTASAPYTIKNGVKLVDLLGVVRRLQSTEGSSAAPLLGSGAKPGMDILTHLGEDAGF